MASKGRQRRPQGHPAKVAEKRERRGRSGSSPPAQLGRIAREVCRDAARLETAFDAELWASEVLGMWWDRGVGALTPEFEREIGGAFVEEMARIGDDGALAGLIALGHVAETELGPLALELAERPAADGITPPAWAETIERVEIVRAAAMREEVFDDGATIFLESVHPGEEPHAVGVYIDNNLGVMVKDVLIADSIERVECALREKQPEEGELIIEPMEIREAGERIRAAMALTEMTLDPPVSEDYGRLRSLVLLRTDEIPPTDIGGVPEVDPDERERLHTDFLGSAEAHGMPSESDEADVVRTAIDFCADYVDGRPLRWSPVVAELFMTSWLPRKVVADRDYFEAVPAGLEAWIRYAGRRRGIPKWAIERTLAAVRDYTDEMLAEASSGRARGLAGDFIAAAQDAGVDLSDERALASFVAGWNARSDHA